MATNTQEKIKNGMKTVQNRREGKVASPYVNPAADFYQKNQLHQMNGGNDQSTSNGRIRDSWGWGRSPMAQTPEMQREAFHRIRAAQSDERRIRRSQGLRPIGGIKSAGSDMLKAQDWASSVLSDAQTRNQGGVPQNARTQGGVPQNGSNNGSSSDTGYDGDRNPKDDGWLSNPYFDMNRANNAEEDKGPQGPEGTQGDKGTASKPSSSFFDGLVNSFNSITGGIGRSYDSLVGGGSGEPSKPEGDELVDPFSKENGGMDLKPLKDGENYDGKGSWIGYRNGRKLYSENPDVVRDEGKAQRGELTPMGGNVPDVVDLSGDDPRTRAYRNLPKKQQARRQKAADKAAAKNKAWRDNLKRAEALEYLKREDPDAAYEYMLKQKKLREGNKNDAVKKKMADTRKLLGIKE